MMRKLSLVAALVLAGSISGIIAAQADSGSQSSQSFLYFAGAGPVYALARAHAPTWPGPTMEIRSRSLDRGRSAFTPKR